MNLKLPFVFLGGGLFGFGLAISGMTKPEVVLTFLRLEDLGLLFVLGLAALIVMIVINLAPKVLEKSVTGQAFSKRRRILSRRVIIGAVIFGIGWGICGLCPGSAVASIGVGNYPVLLGILAMFVGAYIHGALVSKWANAKS